MDDMGRHNALLNGSRGEDGAIAAAPVIQAIDLSRIWPPQPVEDIPEEPQPQSVTEPVTAEMTDESPSWRSRLKGYPWPLVVIAAPAAVAIWSGWVGLGEMCGFGPIRPLPGIAPGVVINTAITLPVGVEAYGAYALSVWLGAKDISGTTRNWARASAVGALLLGCLGQIAYHLLAAAGFSRAPWPVVMAVSCLPVVTLALAAALTHMMLADRRADGLDEPSDDGQDEGADAPSPAVTEEAPAALHEAVTGAVTEPPAEPSPRPSRQPSKRTSKQPSGLERARAVIASDGTLSNPEVAKRAKVSVSTVERARRAATKGALSGPS